MDPLRKLVKLGGDAVFPKAEFDRRIARLRTAMGKAGINALLVNGPENLFYLSGQQTPGYYTFQCLVVPAAGDCFMVIRTLEAMNARSNTYIDEIIGYDDDKLPANALADELKARGLANKRLGIDRNGWFLPVNLYDRLVVACGAFVDASGMVESLRRVKSPLEIAQMKASAVANDVGMAKGLAAVRAGNTENDVAAALMGGLIAAGSEYVGMEPFVASGPRSGVPHSTWRRRKIESGDLVILESAACINRYHAALFRTATVGNVPQKALDMYAVCDEALAAGLAVMKPGVTCAQVHNAVQQVIDRHGMTAGYRKRSGYSLGIAFAPDWGEGNILSLFRGVDVPLEPGMFFHVPITLREYGKFTVAVSETVLVTDKGIDVLSKLERKLTRVAA